MENKINEKSNDEIVSEIVEKLKGKNYATIIGILERVKANVEIYLTLN
ncbi:hypothetical protein [Flavobacterium marginilacus]|nr:hypothetical protein [Flavobacterium marginilacus]